MASTGKAGIFSILGFVHFCIFGSFDVAGLHAQTLSSERPSRTIGDFENQERSKSQPDCALLCDQARLRRLEEEDRVIFQQCFLDGKCDNERQIFTGQPRIYTPPQTSQSSGVSGLESRPKIQIAPAIPRGLFLDRTGITPRRTE